MTPMVLRGQLAASLADMFLHRPAAGGWCAQWCRMPWPCVMYRRARKVRRRAMAVASRW